MCKHAYLDRGGVDVILYSKLESALYIGSALYGRVWYVAIRPLYGAVCLLLSYRLLVVFVL